MSTPARPSSSEVRRHLWRAFDADYALYTNRTDGTLTVHYAAVEGARERLAALVDAENTAGSGLRWRAREDRGHLVLEVTGPAEQGDGLALG